MAETTKIEWTATYLNEPVLWKGEMTNVIPGATFNLVIGCEKVSPACKFCYAEKLDKRWGGSHWGPGSDRKIMSKAYWQAPLNWNKEAGAAGVIRKVFCSSLADWAEDHPSLEGPRQQLFDLIQKTPNLIWLLLTKRPENINRFLPYGWKIHPPNNVWFGTTVENQEYADDRINELLKVKAYIRFISYEPALGAIDIKKYLGRCVKYSSDLELKIKYPVGLFSDRYCFSPKIHWVICGGESGDRKARPIHPAWALSLRNQCAMKGADFFFKQWGEYYTHFINMQTKLPSFKHYTDYQHFVNKDWVEKGDKCISIDGRQCKMGKDFKDCAYPVVIMNYVGKKNSGRMLDGKEYNGMPDFIEKA